MGGAFGTRGRRGRAFGTVVMMMMTMTTMMMCSIRVASATTWIPLPMDDDRFRVVRSYAPPEYAVDADGRARFRGWFASSTKLDAGDDAASNCVECHEREREVAFAPCGHFVCCSECGLRVSTCPLCRGAIEKKLRIYVG